jgi:hypothetical protein
MSSIKQRLRKLEVEAEGEQERPLILPFPPTEPVMVGSTKVYADFPIGADFDLENLPPRVFVFARRRGAVYLDKKLTVEEWLEKCGGKHWQQRT